ncbi:MAG TPA: flavodoxin family protein [Clostridiales bacterium]|nr:flavodoxin family protein [Clostridiales bacterium]
MPKKIVVLADIERQGNTAALTKAFTDAAEAKGHTVTVFNTAEMEIGGCRDCRKCFLNGKACCFGDDFNKIAPVLPEADVAVFVFPLYWYSFPAKIKAAIDKIFSFYIAKTNGSGITFDLGGKQAALICGAHQNEPAIFDGVRIPYALSLAYLEWESIGEVYVTGLREVGDIEKTDGAARVAALVEKI